MCDLIVTVFERPELNVASCKNEITNELTEKQTKQALTSSNKKVIIFNSGNKIHLRRSKKTNFRPLITKPVSAIWQHSEVLVLPSSCHWQQSQVRATGNIAKFWHLATEACSEL